MKCSPVYPNRTHDLPSRLVTGFPAAEAFSNQVTHGTWETHPILGNVSSEIRVSDKWKWGVLVLPINISKIQRLEFMLWGCEKYSTHHLRIQASAHFLVCVAEISLSLIQGYSVSLLHWKLLWLHSRPAGSISETQKEILAKFQALLGSLWLESRTLSNLTGFQ